MIRVGRPRYLTTCLNRSSAVCRVVTSVVVGRKDAYFVSLSTITRTASLPFVLGKPVIRSREMSSKGLAGISSS